MAIHRLAPRIDTDRRARPNFSLRCNQVIKKSTIVFVLVIAILAGLYLGASPNDRNRWLAHLGLSKHAAARVRQDIKAEQVAAMAQQQQRDLRKSYAELGGANGEDSHTEFTSLALDPDAACARFREVNRLRKQSSTENEEDSGISRLQKELEARCGSH